MKRNTIKSLLICLGLVLALLGALYGLLGMSASARVVQPSVHSFYGAVEIDGQPAPVGIEVEARGEGVITCLGNPLMVDPAGKYGGPSGGEAKLAVQGDVGNGTHIEFYVNGKRAECYDPEGEEWIDHYEFYEGAITELNLFYTGTYTLTVVSEGCCPISVTYDTITATVAAGDIGAFTDITGGVTVTLEAITGTYCSFGGWGGDLTNPITIPMLYNDEVVTATCFDLSVYTLTVQETGSGSGTVIKTPEQVTYIHGTNVVLTATPSVTSMFGGWSGDVESSKETVTITMDNDKEITATFDFYSVTISPPVDEGAGNPGEWVYYMLQVTNTGGVADTFTATTVSDHAWPVVSPSTVGPVAAGEAKGVIVGVQVPPVVVSGTVDVVTFTVTSQGDPRKSATALLMTTAAGGIPANRIFMPLIIRN